MRRVPAGWPDGRTRLLGIVGDPLDHSLSPRLHSEVLRRLDRNLIYVPFPVSAPRLRRFVREAPEFGLVGFNVTTPYKERVARWVRPADGETRRTGIVNTVRYRRGEPVGCGTDGEGILSHLDALGLGAEPFGLLGFGATARSLTARSLTARGLTARGLTARGPTARARRRGAPPAAIVTRRPAAVRATLRRWGGDSAGPVLDWATLARGSEGETAWPRLWISALPPSTAVPVEFWRRVGSRGLLIDLNYGPGRTGLVEQARREGWRAAGGLGPLCRQAALSLGWWLGTEVPAELYFRALGASERSLRPVR